MSITFFDISPALGGNGWTPNTIKTRVSLNYKGIPFESEFIQFVDIEPLMKKNGGAPTAKKEDGRDHYTLPAIRNSATNEYITESLRIAAYLDEKFPNKPPLIPTGTRAAIELFVQVFEQKIKPVYAVMRHASMMILDDANKNFFETTRNVTAPPVGAARDAVWNTVKEGLDFTADLYDTNGANKPFYLGDTFSFADTVVIGYLMWVKIILGADSDEWKLVASWREGRWEKFLELTKKWQWQQ
ncbi:hypothetical protein EW145_g5669 [Phellinidium pouzarii]|uniref:GST N-terminal domain-containing protein n=1 Tax=Phellinidium pouzarii TaxID=167371 RepID=A0A4V3XC33_9AGAM|nr:hypothetical protein EW145_g5669 [Phellinidium pouzarii]